MDVRTDKEFDDLLKKRYEDHTIKPDRELWEGINTRLYQKKTDRNIHKVRQLKIAISAVAAILAGVIVYSWIRTREIKNETQIISEISVISAPDKNKNILTSDLNNKIFDEKTEYLNTTPNKKEFLAIEETSESSEKSIILSPDSYDNRTALKTSRELKDISSKTNNTNQPATDIKYPYHKQAFSGKIKGLDVSVLSGMVMSDNNRSKDTRKVDLIDIGGMVDKSDRHELILSDIGYGSDQPVKSASVGNGRKLFPFFIEGSITPELSYRALSVNNKYSLPDYGKSYFNQAERPDFTFSAGISGGFGITDKLILKSGVYYSRYSYTMKTEAFNLIKTGSNGYLVYTSSGAVNITLISSDSLSKESFVKSSIDFSFVNVPLTAEFHLRNNYFLDIGLNLSMLAGQNMNWQAEDYDGNFSDTSADQIDGLEFSSLSMKIGLGKEKYLTRQLSVLINPSVRINLTSLNKTVPVKSYPYSLGLNAGLRYYFD